MPESQEAIVVSSANASSSVQSLSLFEVSSPQQSLQHREVLKFGFRRRLVGHVNDLH